MNPAGDVGKLMSTHFSAAVLGRHSVWAIDRVKDHAWKIGSGVTPNGGAASYLASGVPLLRRQEKRPGRGMCHADHKRWPNAFFASHGLFTMVKAHAQACPSR